MSTPASSMQRTRRRPSAQAVSPTPSMVTFGTLRSSAAAIDRSLPARPGMVAGCAARWGSGLVAEPPGQALVVAVGELGGVGTGEDQRADVAVVGRSGDERIANALGLEAALGVEHLFAEAGEDL